MADTTVHLDLTPPVSQLICAAFRSAGTLFARVALFSFREHSPTRSFVADATRRTLCVCSTLVAVCAFRLALLRLVRRAAAVGAGGTLSVHGAYITRFASRLAHLVMRIGSAAVFGRAIIVFGALASQRTFGAAFVVYAAADSGLTPTLIVCITCRSGAICLARHVRPTTLGSLHTRHSRICTASSLMRAAD